ncbi:acetyl-CoA carboxylase biotin carboxyl carrier protein subunit [Gluconobacter sp. GP1]|uniref:acetyl-CoA carboxylase biotin carboxyl carrier protein n=1 Tax=Gluconobacter sp. GP1 TaxID=3046423 RepID=UPI00293E5054|nr:acetyl-CoA carboxylase biotin carboxyl carrier protein subunit [Gluconobacter sp. GP1]
MTTLQNDFASFQIPTAGETAQIIGWLRNAGLDSLEVTAGERSFKIVLSPVSVPATTALQGPASRPKGDEPVAVKSPYFGVLSLLRPMQDAPLAPVGSAVTAGETVALLSIGPMQISVTAPCAGTVAEVLTQTGDLTGYGTTILTLIPSHD